MTTVWITADALDYPEGAGHLWVYLNWALGLRARGCRVVWLELVDPTLDGDRVRTWLAALKERLEPYGLAASVALASRDGGRLPAEWNEDCVDLEEAGGADLLINLRYAMHPEVLRMFRRTAMLDIDPGLTQVWMSEGQIRVAPHDVYFTIGETVGRAGSLIPDVGLRWLYTPPCVALDWWPRREAAADAPFTTVSHWASSREWVVLGEESFPNDKRTGFLPFLELPRRTAQPLELALCLGGAEDERRDLLARGWSVRDAHAVASTPRAYQEYLGSSRGEFSCAKPSCVRLQNAWVSDRTLCYLASGKPAVVRHTGPSRFLPDSAGMFRFHDPEGAARALDAVAADYERQCRQARALAEEHFDARAVVGRLLERALD